ncbi:hypothetical protein ACWJKU_14420 [Methylocaldum sp. MU1018]
MSKLQNTSRRLLRVVIGGRWGVFAWSLSGASALAVVLWGLNAVAIPLLMLKTASWGIWGMGVIRESKARAALKP